MSKFQNVPVEEDTKILFQAEGTLGEYRVLYQIWVWDGIFAESIIFAEQFQEDEILGLPYRRFFVKHWKIVYKPNNDTISIFRVFDTRQNPKSIL